MKCIEEAKIQLSSVAPAVEEHGEPDAVRMKAEELGISWIEDRDKMATSIEEYYQDQLSSLDHCFSFIPTDEELNRISMEPVNILSDESWLNDFDRKNHKPGDGMPLHVGPGDPSFLLDSFRAFKYRFVIGLEELEKMNLQLDAEIKRYCPENNN